MKILYFKPINIFLVGALCLEILFLIESDSLKSVYGVYPRLVALMLMVSSIACIIQELINKEPPKKGNSFRSYSKLVMSVAAIIVYVVAISTLGYFLSTFVYLFIMFQKGRSSSANKFVFNIKSIVIDILLSLAVVIVIGIVFKGLLGLIFPDAILI